MLQIICLSREKVVNQILENMIKGGVLLEQEKSNYHERIESLSDSDLIIALIDSHDLVELSNARKN